MFKSEKIMTLVTIIVVFTIYYFVISSIWGVGIKLSEIEEIKTEVESLRKENNILKLDIKILEKNIEKNSEEISRLSSEYESLNYGRRVDLTDNELQLMYYLVEAESGICSIEERRLVASAIINRILDERFPETLEDVVTQRNAFTPVHNGSLYENDYTTETVIAVHDALVEDHVDGGVFFMNESISDPKNVRWFKSNLELVANAEYMDFYK